MQRKKAIWSCCAVFRSGDPKGMYVTVSHKEWVMFADLLWELCSGERVRKCNAGVTVSSCVLLCLTLCSRVTFRGDLFEAKSYSSSQMFLLESTLEKDSSPV